MPKQTLDQLARRLRQRQSYQPSHSPYARSNIPHALIPHDIALHACMRMHNVAAACARQDTVCSNGASPSRLLG